jgi:hypothetical protein
MRIQDGRWGGSATTKRTPGSGPQVAKPFAAAQRLYTDNIFPSMGGRSERIRPTSGTWTRWDARCHDLHTSKAGAAISQDCERCHKMQE